MGSCSYRIIFSTVLYSVLSGSQGYGNNATLRFNLRSHQQCWTKVKDKQDPRKVPIGGIDGYWLIWPASALHKCRTYCKVPMLPIPSKHSSNGAFNPSPNLLQRDRSVDQTVLFCPFNWITNGTSTTLPERLHKFISDVFLLLLVTKD